MKTATGYSDALMLNLLALKAGIPIPERDFSVLVHLELVSVDRRISLAEVQEVRAITHAGEAALAAYRIETGCAA